MQKNIAAYTAPGSNYPEYISINERNGLVVLSARGPGGDPYARTVDVPLPRRALVMLSAEIDKYLAATDRRSEPRVKLREDGFPSRADTQLMTFAEVAILKAMNAVEWAGGSPALTDAINLLGKAKDRVADHVEAID